MITTAHMILMEALHDMGANDDIAALQQVRNERHISKRSRLEVLMSPTNITDDGLFAYEGLGLCCRTREIYDAALHLAQQLEYVTKKLAQLQSNAKATPTA